jgi:hypothetical protein
MTTDEAVKELNAIGACFTAKDWTMMQTSPEEAWRTCPRADWMAWLIAAVCKKDSIEHTDLVVALCDCFESFGEDVLPKNGRITIRKAVQAARNWSWCPCRDLERNALAAGRRADRLKRPRIGEAFGQDAISGLSFICTIPGDNEPTYAHAAVWVTCNDVCRKRNEDIESLLAYFSVCADIIRKRFPQYPQLDR